MTKKKKPDMKKVAGAVKSLAELQVYVTANLKSIALVLKDELDLDLDLPALTAHESEKRASVPTPMGPATAGSGEIPPPKNGETYTAEELSDPGTFTRPVLVSILQSLGGETKGKMPADLRTEILELSVGSNIGECEFTGEEGVPLHEIEIDGDTYSYGDQVRAFLSAKKAKTPKAREKWIRKIIDEEVSV